MVTGGPGNQKRQRRLQGLQAAQSEESKGRHLSSRTSEEGRFVAPKRRGKEDNKLIMKRILSSRAGPSRGVGPMPFLEPCSLPLRACGGGGEANSTYPSSAAPVLVAPPNPRMKDHSSCITVAEPLHKSRVQGTSLPWVPEQWLTSAHLWSEAPGCPPVTACHADGRLSCRFLCFFRLWRLVPEF